MTQYITAAAFRDMILNASAALEINKQLINDLNVFPVPDGDTGTNMSLTMGTAAADIAAKSPATVGAAAEITASALLRGARGNSGVILSLLFRGVSKTLKGRENADTHLFAAALANGVMTAYNAVMKPAEGTILTVSRVMAETAVEVSKNESDFEPFFEAIINAGNDALAHTVEQNPVLKKAGVVDAGAKGYLFILDAMLRALRGEKLEGVASATQTADRATFSDFDAEDINFTYCTEFIVSKENDKPVSALRDYLNGMGDSLVLVDDDEIIKVHVHTNEPGRVITRALTYGSLVTTKIENMRLQHSENVIKESEMAEAPAKPVEMKEYGIVAVCSGDGVAQVFRDLGADNIVTGGQTMNPSTEDILNAVENTSASTVYVFPNNKNIIMAAEQCAALTEKRVVVIPSKTIPQGISALIEYDETLTAEECTDAFCEAISRVHTVQVTYAARDSEFDGHQIKSGEYLALLESALISAESNFDDLLDSICTALSDISPEFITIIYGQDVDSNAAEAVSAKLAERIPDAEISLVDGKQPVYYYMISAE